MAVVGSRAVNGGAPPSAGAYDADVHGAGAYAASDVGGVHAASGVGGVLHPIQRGFPAAPYNDDESVWCKSVASVASVAYDARSHRTTACSLTWAHR